MIQHDIYFNMILKHIVCNLERQKPILLLIGAALAHQMCTWPSGMQRGGEKNILLEFCLQNEAV